MNKGIKKLQKHVAKIESSNKTIINKTVKRTLKLKKRDLSTIKSVNSHVIEILVHKDTNNFPILKQKLLEHFNEIHAQYPFISIGYDTEQTNKKNRVLKAENGNRILLTINWNDYMQQAFQEAGKDIGTPFPSLGLEQEFEEMKMKNLKIIQASLKYILSKVKENSTREYTDHEIPLVQHSLSYQTTRNHFINLAKQFNKQYNGVIELFHIGMNDGVILRVHWNIYIAQLAAKEKINKNVDLEFPEYHQEKLPLYPPNIYEEGKQPDHNPYIFPSIPTDKLPIEDKKPRKKVRVKKKPVLE